MDGAHLRFRDSVRTAEIELDRRRFSLAFLGVLENCVDFLLRKLSAQGRLLPFYRLLSQEL
jgi:hypothetical protein